MSISNTILRSSIVAVLATGGLSACIDSSGGTDKSAKSITDASNSYPDSGGSVAVRKLPENTISGRTSANTIIEAFGDNGSYYQTSTRDNDSASPSFDLEVPANLGLRLVATVSPASDEELIIPLGFRDNRNDIQTRLQVGKSDHVDLGYLPLPQSRAEAQGEWDRDGDGIFDKPFVVDDAGANNPLAQADADSDGLDDWNDPDQGGYRFDDNTPDPLDTDKDGIVDVYDKDHIATPDIPDADRDGLRDDRDDANVGNLPNNNRRLEEDNDGDGYQESDKDHNGIPDYDQDHQSPTGYRNGNRQNDGDNHASRNNPAESNHGDGAEGDGSASSDNSQFDDHQNKQNASDGDTQRSADLSDRNDSIGNSHGERNRSDDGANDTNTSHNENSRWEDGSNAGGESNADSRRDRVNNRKENELGGHAVSNDDNRGEIDKRGSDNSYSDSNQREDKPSDRGRPNDDYRQESNNSNDSYNDHNRWEDSSADKPESYRPISRDDRQNGGDDSSNKDKRHENDGDKNKEEHNNRDREKHKSENDD